MAKGKGPKKGAGKKKKQSSGFLTKFVLFLLLLALAFVLAGFFSPGGKTLLRRADEASGLKWFQPAHDKLILKAKNGWAWIMSSDQDAAKTAEPTPHLKPIKGPSLKLTPAQVSPPKAQSSPENKPEVITEKRSNGQVIRKLETLQKPLGQQSAKEQADLEAIIKKKTKD